MIHAAAIYMHDSWRKFHIEFSTRQQIHCQMVLFEVITPTRPWIQSKHWNKLMNEWMNEVQKQKNAFSYPYGRQKPLISFELFIISSFISPVICGYICNNIHSITCSIWTIQCPGMRTSRSNRIETNIDLIQIFHWKFYQTI